MYRMIIGLLFLIGALQGSPVSDNTAALVDHQIWKISSPNPLTSSIITKVHQFEEGGKLDILSLSSTDSKLRVFPDTLDEVRQELEKIGAVIDVQVTNVAQYLKELEKEFPSRSSKPRQSKSELPIDSYMTFSEIEAYLEAIASEHPSIVTKESIGKSIENRDIWMMTIKSNSVEPKKSVFVEGGLHAREWISPAVTLYLLDMSVKSPCLMEGVEIRIVPVANPDGYVYTHTSDRLWRKNRRNNGANTCYGVDLNRNWDHQYGVTGSSSNTCSEVYRGTGPFSEPETTAVSNAMRNTPNLELVLAMHSYSQLVLYPWGYTLTDAPDKDRLKAAADEFAAVVKSINGVTYTTMSGAELYPASGATEDWAYAELGVKYSYTIELRDTGTYGFELPANQIDANRKEIWAGFEHLVEKIKNECP